MIENTCATTYAQHKVAMVSMVQLVAGVSKKCLLAQLADNPDASVFDLKAFEQCDWEKLAETAREVADVDAWKRLAAKHFSLE